MKKIAVSFAYTIFLVLIIPGFITYFFDGPVEYEITEPINSTRRETDDTYEPQTGQTPAPDDKITVFNPDSENRIGFEDYICGVVAAEMPAGYGTEALKAQAVAARTYAYKRLNADGGRIPDSLSINDIDSIYQAYMSRSELTSIWGNDFEDNYSKINDAVKATENQIMVYRGEPIEAVFHSSSAGMTVDAENVWNKEYPYLRSVVSTEEDEVSEKKFETREVIELLRQSVDGIVLTDEIGFLEQFEVISKTDAGYVLEARVGNMTITGRQLREALGLKSAAFTVSEEGGTVAFVTKGYGHGVGMSQSGAGFMAENGYNYRDILEHYYSGVSIETVDGQ